MALVLAQFAQTVPFWGAEVPLDFDGTDPAQILPADASPWDVLLVPGLDAMNAPGYPSSFPYLPGFVKLPFLPQLKEDKKDPLGADGTTTTSVGVRAVESEMILTMWTAPQFAQWQKQLPKLTPKPGKFTTGGSGATVATRGIQAFDVYNPALALHGIDAIMFLAIGPPVSRGGSTPDVRDIKIMWRQWIPPKRGAAVNTPKKAKGVVGKVNGQLGVPTANKTTTPPSATATTNANPSCGTFTPPGQTPSP